MPRKTHPIIVSYLRRIAIAISAVLLVSVAFTIYANLWVDDAAQGRIYVDVDSVPYNKVGLLLGTNPLNRLGGPNSYFTNRINIRVRFAYGNLPGRS